jgi:DUF1680 family protein
MIWGKLNNVFSVLMNEAGEVVDTLLANDHSPVPVKIKSITRFPLEGRVEYVVNPSETKTFALNFRVPGWSENFVAKIGDKTYKSIAGKFLKIERAWRAGDKIIISFDMPVQIIPGGLSYPDKIAFKRGPQVLAVDKALSNEVVSLKEIQFEGNKVLLIDAKEKLPLDWSWKQAYTSELLLNHKPKQIVLVPYAEAGQQGTELAVWIDSANTISK